MIKRFILLSVILLFTVSASFGGLIFINRINQTAGGGSPTIQYVTVYVRWKTEAGTETAKIRTYDTLNLSDETDFQTVTTSYADHNFQFDLAPDGGAWTTADVNNLKLGVLLDSSIANTVRVTQIYAVVTWSDLTTNTLRPSADYVDGSWTDQTAGTSLAAQIDEVSADDDTTYVYSSTNSDYFMVSQPGL